MNVRVSSTPNEDYWHSTYGNFCKCDQGRFSNFWAGPWDDEATLDQSLGPEGLVN